MHFLPSPTYFCHYLLRSFHKSPGALNSNLPTKVFGAPQTRGKQIPGCLYACDNSWRLKELVVQLAVKVPCPLFGIGIWWGLPPQHRGVLWERVKSMRSVRRRRLRVPRVGAAGVMVLEMAVTQIRSTVQYRRWSPPIQVYLLFNCSTSLSLSSFLPFSLCFSPRADTWK